jgi:hypothetical protein
MLNLTMNLENSKQQIDSSNTRRIGLIEALAKGGKTTGYSLLEEPMPSSNLKNTNHSS